jgi:hypothetical protein
MGGTWTRRKTSARDDLRGDSGCQCLASLNAAETSMATDAKGEAQRAEQRPRDQGRSVLTAQLKLFLIPLLWISFFLG